MPYLYEKQFNTMRVVVLSLIAIILRGYVFQPFLHAVMASMNPPSIETFIDGNYTAVLSLPSGGSTMVLRGTFFSENKADMSVKVFDNKLEGKIDCRSGEIVGNECKMLHVRRIPSPQEVPDPSIRDHWFELKCEMPPGKGRDIGMQVYVNELSSRERNFGWNFARGLIHNVSVQQWPLTAAEEITVYGENFGTRLSDDSIAVEQLKAPVDFWCDNKIIFRSPAALYESDKFQRDIRLQIRSEGSTIFNELFIVKPPVLHQASLGWINIDVGFARLNIKGFGLNHNSIVLVDNVSDIDGFCFMATFFEEFICELAISPVNFTLNRWQINVKASRSAIEVSNTVFAGFPSPTPSSSPTGTPSLTSSLSTGASPSNSRTPSVTPSSCNTPSGTPSSSVTPSETPTRSRTPSGSASITGTPSVTNSRSSTPTITSSGSSTMTETSSPTASTTISPTTSSSATATPTLVSPTATSVYPPFCFDGKQEGAETDIDCGAKCPSCTAGFTCQQTNDCQGNLKCYKSLTCADSSVMNLKESALIQAEMPTFSKAMYLKCADSLTEELHQKVVDKLAITEPVELFVLRVSSKGDDGVEIMLLLSSPTSTFDDFFENVKTELLSQQIVLTPCNTMSSSFIVTEVKSGSQETLEENGFGELAGGNGPNISTGDDDDATTEIILIVFGIFVVPLLIFLAAWWYKTHVYSDPLGKKKCCWAAAQTETYNETKKVQLTSLKTAFPQSSQRTLRRSLSGGSSRNSNIDSVDNSRTDVTQVSSNPLASGQLPHNSSVDEDKYDSHVNSPAATKSDTAISHNSIEDNLRSERKFDGGATDSDHMESSDTVINNPIHCQRAT